MKVKKLKLSKIKPYPGNPRVAKTAVEAVAASIEAYGYSVPIVVDKKHVVLAGHNRLAALKLLGWKSAECVVVDLPPDRARAFRLADNRTHELATWDYAMLMAELRTLDDVSVIRSSFPDVDIDKMLFRESGGAGAHSPPTPAAIMTSEIRQNTRFATASETRRGNVTDVRCMGCNTDFGVDVTDIQRRLERARYGGLGAVVPVPDAVQVVRLAPSE